MLFVTTDSIDLPGCKLVTIFDMVTVMHSIQLSEKSWYQLFKDRKKKDNDLADVRKTFEKLLPQGANAVVAVKMQHSVQWYRQKMFAVIIMTGTPVYIEGLNTF